MLKYKINTSNIIGSIESLPVTSYRLETDDDILSEKDGIRMQRAVCTCCAPHHLSVGDKVIVTGTHSGDHGFKYDGTVESVSSDGMNFTFSIPSDYQLMGTTASIMDKETQVEYTSIAEYQKDENVDSVMEDYAVDEQNRFIYFYFDGYHYFNPEYDIPKIRIKMDDGYWYIDDEVEVDEITFECEYVSDSVLRVRVPRGYVKKDEVYLLDTADEEHIEPKSVSDILEGERYNYYEYYYPARKLYLSNDVWIADKEIGVQEEDSDYPFVRLTDQEQLNVFGNRHVILLDGIYEEWYGEVVMDDGGKRYIPAYSDEGVVDFEQSTPLICPSNGGVYREVAYEDYAYYKKENGTVYVWDIRYKKYKTNENGLQANDDAHNTIYGYYALSDYSAYEKYISTYAKDSVITSEDLFDEESNYIETVEKVVPSMAWILNKGLFGENVQAEYSTTSIEQYVITRDTFIFDTTNNMRFAAVRNYVNVRLPLTQSFSADTYQEHNLNDFVAREREKAINPIRELEKNVYFPASISDGAITPVSKIKFNLHFRKRGDNWNVMDRGSWNGVEDIETPEFSQDFFSYPSDKKSEQSDLLMFLGFTNNDVRYQKNKLKKSFIRLSFYDSTDETTQNLVAYHTIFYDAGKAFKKFAQNFDTADLYSANKELGRYYIISEDTENKSYEINKNDVKYGGRVSREPLLSGKTVDEIEEYRLSSQFVIEDRNNGEASSEGFYLYRWKENYNPPVSAEDCSGETLYMRVEFNHAGYGRVVPFMMPYKDGSDGNVGVKDFNEILDDWKGDKKGYNLSDYRNYAYIRIKTKYDNVSRQYFYYPDDATYGKEACYDGDSALVFNLYEGRIAGQAENSVNMVQSEQGEMAVNKPLAAEGAIVNVTGTPAEGYEMTSITVSYTINGEEITQVITADGNNASFIMPDVEVTVTPTFTQQQP